MTDEFVEAQQPEITPDRSIVGEYKTAVDTLSNRLFGKGEYSEEEVQQSEALLEAHVGTMLGFLHEGPVPQKEVVSNLQLTYLYAHFADRVDLKKAVQEGVVGDLQAATSVLEADREGNMLGFLNNILHLSDRTTAEEIQKSLSERSDILEHFFGGERTVEVANLCRSLATLKFSPNAAHFTELLKSHTDDLVSYIDSSDLRKSKSLADILGFVYGNSAEQREKLNKIFFEKADIFLEGIKSETMDFTSELRRALQADIEAEKKIELINKFEAAIIQNPESKRTVVELLIADFNNNLHEEPEGPDARVLDILNDHPDIMWETVKDASNLVGISRFLRYCTEQNRDFIFQQISNALSIERDPEKVSKYFDFLIDSCGARVGNTKKAIELYGQHVDIVQNVIFDPYIAQHLSKYKKDIYEKVVNQLASYGEKEQAAPAIEMVYHMLDYDPKQFFKENDMDEDVYVEAWRRGMGDVVENFRLNRIAVEKLIQERGKDAVHTLSSEFGIKNFGRYPLELLTKQLDEKDDTEAKYGIILYPEFDHGLAFTSDEDREMMRSLYEQLQGKYKLRIGEVGSRYELAKRLSLLHKKYGKASFAVIGAHGAEEMMQLGFGSERRELSTSDLEGAAAERVGDYFEDGSSIILESCSTGADSGIAEKLSSVLGKRVIAPTEVAGGIQSVSVHLNEDMPPSFEVDFYYSTGREYETGTIKNERRAVEEE